MRDVEEVVRERLTVGVKRIGGVCVWKRQWKVKRESEVSHRDSIEHGGLLEYSIKVVLKE